MAQNGNDPRLEKLESTLRGVVPAGQLANQPANRPDEPDAVTYDLARRIGDTAKAIRDLADYSNNVAGDLERIVASYISNMGRLMGKIGK